MKKRILFILFFCFSLLSFSQITLTHNVGNTPIVTGMSNCEDEEYWARTFTLSDFGITTSEQFIIRSGQVAISNSYDGAQIGFSVFSIDSNFPNSSPNYIGGGTVLTPAIGINPEVVQINFVSPIVVPASIERLLVVVSQGEDIYNPAYKDFIIAGTEQDNDISWFSGCREYYNYITTDKLNEPVPNANFFINVTGETIDISNSGDILRLSHNVGDSLVRTNMFGCSSAGFYWARVFNLDQFGVLINEELVINSGQVGIGGSDGGASIKFNIYKIDENFPDSFSESNLIGSSKSVRVPYISEYNPQIINITFDEPIIIIKPAVDKILVEVVHDIVWGSGVMFIAGTEVDTDFSWYKGCGTKDYYDNYCNMKYITTEELGRPDGKFYINITGNKNIVAESKFEIYTSSICSEFLKEFRVEKKENVASVVWDFGDPSSGANNVSTDISPFHDFSADGEYTITAIVTANNGDVEALTETIDVKEPPNAYGINNVEGCEAVFGTGVSASFDTSNVQSQVLGSQTGRVVTYIDGSGNEYDLLPNPFTNTLRDRETITVRVARNEERCCYSETTFDLIVNPKPILDNIENVYACDDDADGLTFFNLTQIQSDLSTNNAIVDFFYENGQQISNSELNAVVNKVQNEEAIIVKVTNTLTNCYNEAAFKLIVNPLPIANPLQEIIGCDDNNDGISEYFDISNIEANVLSGQIGMEVTYYNSNGVLLPKPLPNPYTNNIQNLETITVRVTNQQTNCYTETPLVLKTSNKPQINKPQDIYACNEGNGISTFNLASIEQNIIGSQNNLNVYYYDANGSDITNSITSNFKNTEPWTQTISVKAENALSNLCVSETNFKLIVNELPEVDIENEYFLCNLEPSLPVIVSSGLDLYEWKFEDGSIISNTHEVDLVDAGNYTLKITEVENNNTCENTYHFKLIRSVLPKIDNVEYQELSDSNFIKINASGDGDFQYSIDGDIYQSNNTFNNILGGIYTVYVRDNLGCGSDSREVVIIDYPKYFTPNNDGVNDTWKIKGLLDYPNAEIRIYDRYGKFLKQISPQSNGWDGTFNGNKMLSSDYWFTVKLNKEKEFKGHFSLKI